jgi:glucose/arabinose dehydrogenase
MKTLMSAAAAAVLMAACAAQPGVAQAPASGPAPLETRAAQGKGQVPAFPGQTRAPELKAGVAYEVSDYVTGIEKPWGLAFLPDGGLLITEKPGRLRHFKDGSLSEPIQGVPAVDARGQGGLLGLAIDPNFSKNGLVYLAFSEPGPDRTNNAAILRGKLILNAGAPRLDNPTVIWRQSPPLASALHYGGRLVFARDGALFYGSGERSILPGRMQAQKLDATLGKVIRINSDGTIPKDNPFVGRPVRRPRSGRSATATSCRPRSTRKPASSGPSSMARAAAMSSTFRARARTTVGPPSPTAWSTWATPSVKASPRRRAWSSRSTTGTR